MLVSETCMFVRLRAKPECDNTGEDRIKPSKIHGYSLLQSTSGKKIHPYEKKKSTYLGYLSYSLPNEV